jgi:hypothetical protein
VLDEILTYKKPIPLPRHISTFIKRSVGHVRLAEEEFRRPEYIPSLARLAAALGLMKSYRVYVLLQHLNRHALAGRGKFVLTAQHLATLSKWLKLSPLTIKRTIRQMTTEGIFLYAKASKYPYVSLVGRVPLTRKLSELAAKAGISDPLEVSYRKEVLDLEDFASLRRFSAIVFNGWLRVSSHAERRIRWEDLEGLWGRSRPTLDAWIDIAGIHKIHNVAYFEPPGPFPEDIYVWQKRVRGETYFCIQRANTLVSEGLTRQANRGVCRKAAAMMCKASENGGESPELIRSNWPYVEVPSKHRKKAYKRMQKGIGEHPEKTHYRHERDTLSPRTGKVYQVWLCVHREIGDLRTQWEWELRRYR